MSKTSQDTTSREDISSLNSQVARMGAVLEYVQKKVDTVDSKLDAEYMTRSEFIAKMENMTARIVAVDDKYSPFSKYFGLIISTVTVLVVTAIVSFFLRKP